VFLENQEFLVVLLLLDLLQVLVVLVVLVHRLVLQILWPRHHLVVLVFQKVQLHQEHQQCR
jgi:hypothetical protein